MVLTGDGMVLKWLKSIGAAGADNDRFPWSDEDQPSVEQAVGDLAGYLTDHFSTEQGVHTESLMVATGALAGFAAIYGVWETGVKPGRLRLMSDIEVMTGADGRSYYAGEVINRLLLPVEGAEHTLWGFVCEGVSKAGVKPPDVEDLASIMEHVAGSLGAPHFGQVRMPEGHHAAWPAPEILPVVWPRAARILSGADLSPDHWCAACALLARDLITASKDVLDPRLSVRIVMEAALATAKVDPATVQD